MTRKDHIVIADVHICNDAGEVVYNANSDAEAVRWWLESGRPGDYLKETDELLLDVAKLLDLDET